MTKNRLVPFCMFTDPELARVGRNESEARRDGIEYRVAKIRAADVPRTRTVSEPRGFLKMLLGIRIAKRGRQNRLVVIDGSLSEQGEDF